MKKVIAAILSLVLVMSLILPASAFSSVPLKSITLDKTSMNLKIGQSYNLKATLSPVNTTQKLMIYATSNKNVAAIEASGKITAAGGGTATITVTVSGSKISATCNVTVEQPKAVEKPKPVKLTWWTFQNSDMDFMQSTIEKYNKENKLGVTIEYVIQTSNNFRQALDLAFQSNQAPDIFTGQDLANYYVPKGQAEPLDKYLTPEMKQRYGNILYSEGDNGVKGKIYSLINTGITYRLMYNKDLFAKAGIAAPPKTLAEMVADAKKITEVGKADKVYGFAINMKNTQTSMERSVNVVGMRSGFRYFDYKTTQFNFTPYKPILDALHQMVIDGSMFPGVESLDIDPLRTQFSQGKIGMYFGGAWEPAWYASQNPKSNVNFGAAPDPTIDGTVKGPAFISGLRWLYMSSKTPYKDQVWDVMKYFYTDDVQGQYYSNGLGVTMVPSVIAKAQKPTLMGAADFAPTKYDAIYPTVPNERTLKIEGKPFNDIFAAIIMGSTQFDWEIYGLNKKYNEALQAAIKDGSVKFYSSTSWDPASLIK